jgi:hypothetical protein
VLRDNWVEVFEEIKDSYAEVIAGIVRGLVSNV